MRISTSRSITSSLLTVLACIAALTQMASALISSGPLELDGNVTTAGTHDWDQVFAGAPANALISNFLTDAVNSKSDDTFKGGGSKDGLGIQQGPWLSTASKTDAPNDIAHADTAFYSDNGHLILYAGMDRFDRSATAIVSFWFLKNTIAINPNVTTNGSHLFAGQHADGDLLLVSTFTMAGSTSAVSVFRWSGNDSSGSLVAVNAPVGTTRATVNSTSITVPWSFTDKKGATKPAAGEFLEEGVDLTALGLDTSYSTFIAATRSSASFSSTVSDFVIGTFAKAAAPAFTGISKAGDSVIYPLTVTNTGPIPIYVQNVTDTLLGNIVHNGVVQPPGGPITNISTIANLANPLAPAASITVFVTRIVQTTDPDPTTDVATFVLNAAAAFSGASVAPSAANSVNLFQPSASLTVTASPTSATQPGTPITYTYTVHNTSSADSPNLGLSTSNVTDSFADTLLGNLEADAIAAGGGSVAPGGSFSFAETRAIHAGDPTALSNVATVSFTLAQNLGSFTNVVTAQGSASVTLLPHLTISKAATLGTPNTIHPGDTASFTITVGNDGAGPATSVVVSDALPDANLLTWSIASSTFDTSSLSAGDVLTASISTLAAGSGASVTVSAVIPSDVFPSQSGTGNGNPLPSGLFELDANAADDDTVNGDDWSNIFAANDAAAARKFVTDRVNTTQDDIFEGGGSKDVTGIQQGPWLFTDSKPQAKDDIIHSFAALYHDPSNGDWIAYAGMDRYDNAGDATAGFWFFKNTIGENPNVTTGGGHPFTGTHSDGDILLVSDFPVGGSTSTVTVYRWTGDDATGSLVPVSNVPGSTLAKVNGASITVPWPYTNKSGGTEPATGELLEEGVNLTALGVAGCFSSFLAETRSSQSPTATLSDFVVGPFDQCNRALLNAATVQADGIAPIASNQVTISVVP